MPQKTSVAVVVPVLNESGGLLERTLDGLQNQTRRPDCIVVVDDGSTHPVRIPERLHSDVEILRLPSNIGGAGARNRGARLSDTSYVLFLNCDVVLAPGWLERAVAFMERDPAAGAISGTIVPVAGKAILRAWRLQFIETKSHRARLSGATPVTWLVGHAILVRRSVFDELGGFYEKYRCAGEDWDICQRILEHGYSISHLPDLLAESHEVASVDRLARKSVRNGGWDIRTHGFERPCAAVQPVRPVAATASIVRLLGVRMARNLVRRRIRFLPVDAAVAVRSIVLVWRAARPEAPLSRPTA